MLFQMIVQSSCKIAFYMQLHFMLEKHKFSCIETRQCSFSTSRTWRRSSCWSYWFFNICLPLFLILLSPYLMYQNFLSFLLEPQLLTNFPSHFFLSILIFPSRFPYLFLSFLLISPLFSYLPFSLRLWWNLKQTIVQSSSHSNKGTYLFL